jgi:transposase
MGKSLVRYSEAFKRHVVSEIESGSVSGVEEARRKFGVAGGSTVQQWLRKYGKSHLLSRIVRVETVNERNELSALKAEIKGLKQALADSHMETVLYRNWFKIACRDLGVSDVESYKKKRGMKRSAAAGRKARGK